MMRYEKIPFVVAVIVVNKFARMMRMK